MELIYLPKYNFHTDTKEIDKSEIEAMQVDEIDLIERNIYNCQRERTRTKTRK